MEKIIESNKEQDTYDLGYELGQHAKPGQVFTLVGDLGVGKTVFTKGLAYNLCGTDAIVCPIMDARRGQVYTGIYEFCGNELVVLEDQMAISIEEVGDHLKKYDKRIIFLGDGVPVFRARLADEILAEEIKAGRDIQFAPANMNRQRAASVGTLGLRYYAAGKTETAMEHEPDYLRLSQAERERKEREAKSIQ